MFFFKNLGIIDFKEAWGVQEDLLNSIIKKKREGLKTENYIIFCQHPHVYTLGKSGKAEHLLLNSEGLKSRDASFYKINRGGDITYHGPGQLVIYPILDLDNFFTDIHKYLRFLEEVVILVLKKHNLSGFRINDSTGVWLGDQKVGYKKICAMGVRTSRWVTMHGLAFNVDVDLSYFNSIIPCGITDKGVTSLNNELGKSVNFLAVEESFRSCFQEVFNCKIVD